MPLNAQGVAQAAVTGRWFAEQGIRFDEAWSSDLSRARVVRPVCRNVRCKRIVPARTRGSADLKSENAANF